MRRSAFIRTPAAEAAAGDWDAIVGLLDHPRVVALGETGLDRYWDYAPIEVQRDYFDRHLRLSQERDLAVVIHCRDAQADMMPMLREAVARGPLRGVLHAFSGDAAMAAECLDLGLYVSFAGNVTYTNKKFQALREAAATVPADRILIETDSPYLTPEPLRGKQKRNEPALVAHTAAALAALRGVPLDSSPARPRPTPGACSNSTPARRIPGNAQASRRPCARRSDVLAPQPRRIPWP